MANDLRLAKYSEETPVKVSICTVAYNHQAYIRECLDSLLDQVCDFKVEIIVHDDASTDDTAKIISEYQKAFPEVIKPIFQHDNQYSKGVNPQYNFVFPRAAGGYIAVCDGDDYWCDPNKLAKQVAVLDRDIGIAVTYGKVKADGKDGIIEPFRNGSERDLSALDLKRGMPINTSTACYRNVFQEPPPFLKYAPMGDMTVWAVLGHRGSGKFMPELKPSGYRVHDGGVFSSESHRNQRFMGSMTLLAMAAYHNHRGDRRGMRACMKRLLGSIVELNGVWLSLTETLRKTISVGLKKIRPK